MKRFYLAQLFLAVTVFASPASANNSTSSNEIVFTSEDSKSDWTQEVSGGKKNKQDISKLLDNFAVRYKDKFGSEAEARRRGAFLLTGVVVYQTARVVGHASIWASVGITIVGGFVTGGPPLAAAAYLNALATVPAASATVEAGSLALGTAASWIPGLP